MEGRNQEKLQRLNLVTGLNSCPRWGKGLCSKAYGFKPVLDPSVGGGRGYIATQFFLGQLGELASADPVKGFAG